MFSVRRLAELDMALHGKWLILLEFGGAFALTAFLAGIGLAKGQWHSLWLWYLLGLSLNYLPLFFYALWLVSRDEGRKQGKSDGIDRAEAIRYSKQQFWLLVPLVVLFAAIWQEVQRKQK